MKTWHKLSRWAALLALLMGMGTQAEGAERRVYVKYEASGRGAVMSAVAAAGGRVHHEFGDLNAVAVSLPEQALEALGRSSSVLYVEPDPERYLYADTVPYGITMVGAPAVVSAGADGAGILVGVIDSGIYPGHQDFQGVAIDGHPKELVTRTRVKGKVITETRTLGPEDEAYWARDIDGHGTHVSGTIAASANSLGVVGVSPGKVGIYMVKVFGDTGNWVYSSTLLDAAQKAQLAGAKIISMSLGGGSPSTTERDGFAQMYAQGLLLVAAAGNDGTTQLSYPASYDSVISVAAIDSAKAVADFSQQNAQVELAAPGVGVLSTVPYLTTATVAVGGSTYSGDPIEFAARGTASGQLVDGGLGDSTNPAWAGKVVLVQRGSISFYDKVMNVQNSGGVAAVIYNNVPGGLLGTLGAGNSSTIPAIGISDTDGAALLGLLGQSATVTNTEASPANGYAAWDGTSMATPHVSGVAALIWSAHPTATAAQVREALTSTAEDLGPTGRDNAYGFGLVRADLALPVLADLITNGGGGGGGGGDVTAPVISNVSSRPVNARRGTFEITWTTDEASNSVVIFDGLGSYNDPTMVTSHRMSFNGSKGATYIYSVQSTDAAGNTATAGPFVHQN